MSYGHLSPGRWSRSLQISPGNLLILLKDLRLCGLYFPSTQNQLSRTTWSRHPLVSKALSFGWIFVAPAEELLVQLCFLCVCKRARSLGALVLVPLIHFLRLVFMCPHAWLHLPCALSCSQLDAQSSTFPLSTSNRKSAGLTFIFAVCVWLPARRCFWLCGRHWLDHRTQLCCVWTTLQWSHLCPVWKHSSVPWPRWGSGGKRFG